MFCRTRTDRLRPKDDTALIFMYCIVVFSNYFRQVAGLKLRAKDCPVVEGEDLLLGGDRFHGYF